LAQYYYLVASLPMLSYEIERAPSLAEFLAVCSSLVSPQHYSLLESASTTDLEAGGPSCRTLDLWRSWEVTLRNELLRLRAKSLGRDVKTHAVDSTGAVGPQPIAREAFSQESPLQAEDTLNRARWSYLDELESGHYFDIDKILVYALRLRILERKALFDEQKGRDMFDKVYEEIISPVGDV
jgi:hypothetical protein